MRALLRFLFGVGLGASLGAGLLFWDAGRQLDQPLPVTAPVTLEIQPGDGMKKVIRQAQERGLIGSQRTALYTEAYARLSGQAARLQAGEYELPAGLTARGFVALLTSGRTKLHALTLVEGWQFAAVIKAVRESPALRQTLPAEAGVDAVMAAIGHAGVHPEGRFLPETYRFSKGTSDVAFLQRAFSDLERALAQEWDARAPGLPYRTPDEALIMASIVERETGVPAERGQIAGVFVRRLQKGMRLQTDPTVIYGLGAAFDGNLRKRDLLRDGPYNSYTRRGLPPTPICMPGRAALYAALHPADGDALFFVARGDGSHQFSATLAEHEKAVRQFQLKRKS